MNKKLKKALILAGVFVAALIVFSRLTNHEVKDMTADMPEASLPVIVGEVNGMTVNEMHGHIQQMDASVMRDNILPVRAGQPLSLQINAYGGKIDGISYEIRSLDMERLVEEGKDVALSEEGDIWKAELETGELLEKDTEYMLILNLEQDGQNIYYYTRIMLEDGNGVDQSLEFAMNFHETALDEGQLSELSRYLEPSSSADNTTLQKVTIENSLSQIGWGSLDVQQETQPVASVKEVNDSYTVIVISGIVSSENEDGGKDYYDVEEYYRIRPGEDRMFLLNFERDVNEIITEDSVRISGESVNLGIRSADVDYWSGETGNVVCFVQEGDLWSYNRDSSQLTKVYSLRGDEVTDARGAYNEHNIRIINADEMGSVDFIVYGYMNRGYHEGSTGISVCHYDSVTNTVEEWLFIPSDVPYQVMKEKIDQLMYISNDNIFYFTVGNAVHGINLDTKEDTVIIDELKDGAYHVSDNGRYVAWVRGDQINTSEELNITDLDTGKTFQIQAEEGSYIRPLGFSENDCIYGLCRGNDKKDGQNFPMYAVRIASVADGQETVEKSYEKEHIYVRSIRVSEGTIYLNLMRYEDGGYQNAGQDTITNRDMEESQRARISTVKSQDKQTQVVLEWPQSEDTGRISERTAKLIIPESSIEMKMDSDLFTSSYYVYAKGEIVLATDNVRQAVSAADSNMGVVVDGSMDYIWERAKADSRSAVSLSDPEGSSSVSRALNIMLREVKKQADTDQLLSEGQEPLEILKKNMEHCLVLDLTGCTLDQVLYYSGEGSLIYVRTGEEQARIITGYNSGSVWVYDPGKDTQRQMGREEAQKEFEKSGSVYYTYLRIS